MRACLAIGGLAALLIAPLAMAGEPVVLPDITPGATTDFAVAFMLQERVELELKREGHIVITSEAARPAVGDALDQCADVAGCPYAALRQLPASIAIVIRVSRAEEGNLLAEVSAFDKGATAALETQHYLIQPGAEDAFAQEVARLATDILSVRPPASEEDLLAAAKLVEDAERAAEPVPVPEPVPGPVPEPVPEPGPPEPKDLSGLTFEERLAGTGVPKRFIAGSHAAFMKSNQDPRDWLFKSRSHAGRLVLEVRAGYAFGDEDRAADVRVVVDDAGSNTSEWLQEGPVYSHRLRGGLYVGYAPVTWFDAGVGMGLQYGEKVLSTGWRRETEVTGHSGTADPVPALMIDLEFRARFYPVPLGIAKPFLLVGGDLRFFDSFHIIDPTDPPIDYPDPPGGTVPGITGGGGVMIDAGPIVGFFAEGAFTYHLGLRANAAEVGTKPADAPAAPIGRQYTIAVTGGVQFRF